LLIHSLHILKNAIVIGPGVLIPRPRIHRVSKSIWRISLNRLAEGEKRETVMRSQLDDGLRAKSGDEMKGKWSVLQPRGINQYLGLIEGRPREKFG
jgi:hypothetical protein